MLKRIAAILLVVLSLTLQVNVAPAAASSLRSYVDSIDGYRFGYPNGWVPVKVSKGPDVVFRDLIEVSENVSVVISEVGKGKTLTDIGTPTEVGQRLVKYVFAPPESNREAELLAVGTRENDAKTYYYLEYAVKLPTQERHNLSSVAISRGKLFTLNISCTEDRWSKVEGMFRDVVNSFSVY